MCASKTLCRTCYCLTREETIGGQNLYCKYHKKHIKTLVLECDGYTHTEIQKRLGYGKTK